MRSSRNTPNNFGLQIFARTEFVFLSHFASRAVDFYSLSSRNAILAQNLCALGLQNFCENGICIPIAFRLSGSRFLQPFEPKCNSRTKFVRPRTSEFLRERNLYSYRISPLGQYQPNACQFDIYNSFRACYLCVRKRSNQWDFLKN